MKGTVDYNNQFEKLISETLKRHEDIAGYYYYISGKNSISTNYSYINHVIRFQEFINKDLEFLTLDDYTRYLNSLRTKTSGYQRCAYYALKRLSEYLTYSGRVADNYMSHVSSPKNVESIITKQKREKGFLTKEEVKNVLDTAKTGVGNQNAQTKQAHWRERDLAILYVFLSTGMRCSALYKLDMSNINWEDKTIVTIDKGSKVNTYILPDETIAILKKWIEKRERYLYNEDEDALFISNRRKRMTTAAISLIVKKYSANIEGKHITPHKLRATYGTQLYNETRDIKFVQDRMMHSNPKTTELYIRGNEDADRKKAADIMSKFLE